MEIIDTPTTFSKAKTGQDQAVLLSMRAGLILLLLLSVFAIAPLFYPGFIQTHTGFVPLWNIADLRANFGNLAWLPHILTHFDAIRGTGLLPYYAAALLPLSAANALKSVIGLGWLLGGVGMYLWLRSWLGNAGALVSALVAVYLPFQIATVYVRGDWAESLFWGLLPWAILAATFLGTSPRLLLLPVAACFWLALGLTQLGLSIWALLFLMCLVGVVHPKQALLPILSGVAGLVITIVLYVVVAPNQLQLPAPVPFADHYVLPFQLLSASWDTGISRAGWNDGLSLQLGLAALGLTIITLYLWRSSAQHRRDRRLIFFGAASIVLLLPLLGLPAILWIVPGGLLTYPWQLLGLSGLCLAVLAGAAFWLEARLRQLPVLAAVLIIIILSVYPQLQPQFIAADDVYSDLPLAEFGNGQLSLLDYSFAVVLPQETQPEIEPDPLRDQTRNGETDPGSVALEDYGPLQPGDTLLLQVVWQPHQPFSKDLKVFVHLVNAENQVIAQFDGQPRQGEYPTSAWIPGEIIDDNYVLHLPDEASAGPYRVFVGLYDEATLSRLPTPADNEGRAIFDVGNEQ